ncbi:hypothetical protein GCM10009804_61230 [Kribbella hippodromi]|uniref:Uncharacterized protein n=1 Tax=Kribbella hippodromi TaxID=434347 RepID=A0ABP4Q361_9ACTN
MTEAPVRASVPQAADTERTRMHVPCQPVAEQTLAEPSTGEKETRTRTALWQGQRTCSDRTAREWR